jgi:hypothetical protein
LKKSLGGNSYSLMIACITPIDMYLEETLSTLDYAAKASKITNTPVVNEDPKVLLLHELENEAVSL